MVKKAIRPPGLSTRLHALNTESLARTHQRTSVWTTASKEPDRNGRGVPLAHTKEGGGSTSGAPGGRTDAHSPSMGSSVRTTEQPLVRARYRDGQPCPDP